MAAEIEAKLVVKDLEIHRAKEVLSNLQEELRGREEHKMTWKEHVMVQMVIAFYQHDVDRQKELSQRLDSRIKVKYHVLSF